MTQQAINLVNSLYAAVDNKDVDYLAKNLSDRIRFRIGNHPAATEKEEILEANRQFFASIGAMSHTLEDIIFQPHSADSGASSQLAEQKVVGQVINGKISCYGRVDYVRLDGSEHSAVFSTFLEVKDNLIVDYLVFADLSGLFVK